VIGSDGHPAGGRGGNAESRARKESPREEATAEVVAALANRSALHAVRQRLTLGLNELEDQHDRPSLRVLHPDPRRNLLAGQLPEHRRDELEKPEMEGDAEDVA
jgi:hypothetical protein